MPWYAQNADPSIGYERGQGVMRSARRFALPVSLCALGLACSSGESPDDRGKSPGGSTGGSGGLTSDGGKSAGGGTPTGGAATGGVTSTGGAYSPAAANVAIALSL